MKAVILSSYGGAEKLQFLDIPEPDAGRGEVKVRVAGASVNPIDWKIRSGALQVVMPVVLPTVLGRVASGEVVAIGSSVSRLKVGAQVMGLASGAYAEFVVAPEEAWAEVPSRMNLFDAAALPLALLTGAQLVEEAIRARKGQVLLVTGALGGVGRTAVFVAKTLGARVWAGVRGKQAAEAEKLGADGVVALDSASDIANLPPLDAIADTLGGSILAELLGKLKPGGTIGSVVGEPAGAKQRGFVVREAKTHPDSARLTQLALAVVQGKLLIPIVKRFPLSQAREAHELAEQHAGGKVLLIRPFRAREAARAPDHRAQAPQRR